ncbi:hypothetical protein [Cytobacillus sp. IB215316]|nr:hypothetical protein [Cytobacillus sp. IB215316]MDX8362435.1 hypothetical protein [Cytobacillus sp. IB215316]
MDEVIIVWAISIFVIYYAVKTAVRNGIDESNTSKKIDRILDKINEK